MKILPDGNSDQNLSFLKEFQVICSVVLCSTKKPVDLYQELQVQQQQPNTTTRKELKTPSAPFRKSMTRQLERDPPACVLSRPMH